MKTLIIKLNAAGDVVRTTVVLRQLSGEVTWLTAPANVPLLEGIRENLRCVPWDARHVVVKETFDLVINLEDEIETAEFARRLSYRQLFGAYVNSEGRMSYTDDARAWFEMSLISGHGKERADKLKFENRLSYQEHVYAGLGWQFTEQEYVLPKPVKTELSGDVAIAPVAGPVWPMKSWAYYDELRTQLERRGLVVNVLPRRPTLLEHLADVSQHRCLVSGDSLPMHLALGAGVACVTVFNCTSPWEIYEYGRQTKMVSPLLQEHFYVRRFDHRATVAVPLNDVTDAVLRRLKLGAQSTGEGSGQQVI